MAYRCVLSLALWYGLTGNGVAYPRSAIQAVPVGYQRVANAHHVPPASLYALALAESAVSLWRGERPWPWTINVSGRGYRYATRLAAWQALQIFMQRVPLKRIDVGIAQVNLGWNGHRFRSSWHAFEPYANLSAAAEILHRCWERQPGSWLVAAGCYHRPAGGTLAVVFRDRVAHWLVLLQPTGGSPFMWASHVSPDPGWVWTEPRRFSR